jgi:MinD superfamily P-loop ATPase
MRGSDFALFVTEPTPFGLHDLKLVAGLNEKEFHLPAGIVINKSGEKDALIEQFAAEKNLPILMRVPLLRSFAEAYSSGQLLVDVQPDLHEGFMSLFASIQTLTTQAGRSQ